jgi:hypothetical protein
VNEWEAPTRAFVSDVRLRKLKYDLGNQRAIETVVLIDPLPQETL